MKCLSREYGHVQESCQRKVISTNCKNACGVSTEWPSRRKYGIQAFGKGASMRKKAEQGSQNHLEVLQVSKQDMEQE